MPTGFDPPNNTTRAASSGEALAPSETSVPKFCSECGHKFSLSVRAPKFCSECGERVPQSAAPAPRRVPKMPEKGAIDPPSTVWGSRPSADPRPLSASSNLDALLQATAAAKATIVLSPSSSDQDDQNINVTIMGGTPTLMGVPRTDLYAQTLMGAPRSALYSPSAEAARPPSEAAPPAFPQIYSAPPRSVRREQRLGSIALICLLLFALGMVILLLILQPSGF